MQNTIYGLFYCERFHGNTPDLVAWWDDFPQVGHIKEVTNLNGEAASMLLDTHAYQEHELGPEWTLRELEQGVRLD